MPLTLPVHRVLARAALLLCLLSPGAAMAVDDEPFVFKEVDLKLLGEVELLDRRFDRDGLVVRDMDLADYVARLGASLVPKDTPERVEWRFRVLRDPLPNAFALPNGSIYLHSGLLGILETEGELASVLAHEVAHVTGRHSYRSFRSYRKKAVTINLLGIAGGAAAGRSEWSTAVRLIAASTQVILAATIHGYSRELERDADLEGVRALAGAGFDARHMAGAFRRLQAAHDLEQDRIFYTDHPKLQDRIEYVSAATAPTTAAGTEVDDQASRERFRVAVERVSRETVQVAIDARRYRSALALARRLVESDPQISDHAYLLAETYRALGPRTPRPVGDELTRRGRNDAQRLRARLTPAEEERELLSDPDGAEVLRQHRQQAEAHYRRALDLDPDNFKAYRGLGLLFEASGRPAEALQAYQTYLDMGLAVADRERIRRRMEALRAGQADR